MDVWGIGTKLITAYDQPALGAVYKIVSIENEAGKWKIRLKFHPRQKKLRLRDIKNFIVLSIGKR